MPIAAQDEDNRSYLVVHVSPQRPQLMDQVYIDVMYITMYSTDYRVIMILFY